MRRARLWVPSVGAGPRPVASRVHGRGGPRTCGDQELGPDEPVIRALAPRPEPKRPGRTARLRVPVGSSPLDRPVGAVMSLIRGECRWSLARWQGAGVDRTGGASLAPEHWRSTSEGHPTRCSRTSPSPSGGPAGNGGAGVGAAVREGTWRARAPDRDWSPGRVPGRGGKGAGRAQRRRLEDRAPGRHQAAGSRSATEGVPCAPRWAPPPPDTVIAVTRADHRAPAS